MTGYASAQHGASAEDGGASGRNSRLGLEIRSVNSRFLDLSFRLPDELRAHEPALRAILTARLKRGKVEVRAAIDSDDGNALPDPSTAVLQRLSMLQDTIQSWLPDARSLSVADVLRLSGGGAASSIDWGSVLPALAEQALASLMEARASEGKRLATMLQDRIAQLRKLAADATPLVPQLVEQQRLRFMERWKEAMALAEGAVAPEAAQDRALTEATAFAIRIDVAEEVTRLDSHLDELQSLLKKGGEIGKRLDFLIQELHREANTLGSKSATLELTRISVDMKVLIEQMREQVQNIE
ncbi:YicC-like family, N-terminal region [Delftia tsuruhatensis]|uniref:YicC/YloC family endoribonuclease n=1 Tax=Delftia tsuruhatensis TaxID=180282 RepID=UPI001E71E270|nr:YicC/YloC family endoribonuclease [Delftia tsuruhatensis]CAB5685639.1 YicC-like family, N-terminal region [Delftia tsuruhatensis]CAC9690212.1 YicC-like family, N-terminal region [Delftia tsuruhatensis]